MIAKALSETTTELRSYEITLKGYYGGTDDTDALVKWVLAPSDQAIRSFMQKHDMAAIVQDGPDYIEGEALDFNDGIDLVIDRRGNVERWSKRLNLNWRRTWANEAWPEAFNEDSYNSVSEAEKEHRKLCKRFGRRRIR